MSQKKAPPLNVFRVALILAALAVFFSLPALRGSGRSLNYWENLKSFATRFFPPDFSVWPEISGALVETFQIAVLATLFAAVLSLPVAAAASRTVAPRWINVFCRGLLNLIRSIPSLIWALLAVVVVGANSLAGIVALSIYSIGYLGKFYSDAFESVDEGVAEALRASGADRVQAFQYGIWPHAKPAFWSQTLWMLEYNIRSAAIIGYVGAGGIGVWLHTYQEFYRWQQFCAVLCCILAIVVVLDFAGERIRKHFVVLARSG
jgi:phosphonate transport system permease protein